MDLSVFYLSSVKFLKDFLFNYFNTKKLFTDRQSGFIPGNLCVAQLLSIMHEL